MRIHGHTLKETFLKPDLRGQTYCCELETTQTVEYLQWQLIENTIQSLRFVFIRIKLWQTDFVVSVQRRTTAARLAKGVGIWGEIRYQ